MRLHDARGHGTGERLGYVPHCAAVSVLAARVAVGGGDVVAAPGGKGDEALHWRGDPCPLRHSELVQVQLADLGELRAGVVLEAERERHARLEAGVRVEEGVHLRLVPRQDHYHILALVLHLFDERIHSFLPERVPVATHDGIRFINEEDATRCVAHLGLDLRRRLAAVWGHEVRARDFLEDQRQLDLRLPRHWLLLRLRVRPRLQPRRVLQLLLHRLGHLHDPHLHEHLADDARDDRLPSAWVAEEAHVEGLA
mmetsp:Transcript_121240/g.376914  ORF Transcript_121240/g.376914 Transcript_121240/m.376914 type:complete len:254 (+) Transcript_121240:770-1531(+)